MAAPVAQCTVPFHPATMPSRSAADVRREVLKEAKNLECQDDHVLLKAAASLVMLATVPDAAAHLSVAIPRLIALLRGGESLLVKRNVCAALTSIMNASQALYSSVLGYPGVVEGLVCCLRTGRTTADDSTQINAAAAISVFAQSEPGLTKILEASAEDELISILASSADGNLLEETVDALCALASHESSRDTLAHKGAVTELARVIAARPSSDTCVRALLALGMLCGSSPSAQMRLAEAEHAVERLITLTRSTDADIQGISRDLFKALTVNERTRPLVEEAIRAL